uniref:Splicing factor, suppressor of white-apricot homolog n=1 Tax=Saccoglossus kowalevskii TaxID=10224 RepID=A0ABM0LYG2_SACKO|nr:PREDICTED: splicing factor, suppressor of white-apricot homolog [Saccoglossus kowalevskii]
MALHGKKIKTKRAHFFDVIPSGTAKAREEEVDELFVFGYAAKLFRDDEKALYIERGKHLIPWTGDESLMIDRYDGRGYLHDLSDYDVDAWNVEHQLSEEESRIETLCDEERYLALHTDLLEEQHRQEEELKRLNEAIASSESEYSAVGFSYDALPSSSSSSYAVDTYDPTQPTDDYEDEANKENQEKESTSVPDEEPFVPPNGLEIPQDVEVPATAKTHAIIAKTALFVSKNGTQMEIILKTKQANNSQFGFLSFDHYLNPYYKTVLKCIRSGKYTYIPQASEDKSDELDKEKDNHRKSKDDDASTEDEESDADGSGYLHPSLLGSKKTKSPKKTDAPPWPIGTLYPLHPLTGLGEGSLMGPFGPIIPPPPMITSTANNSGTTPAILAPPLPPFLHVAHDGSCVPPLPPPADRVTVPTFSQASAGLTALTAAPPPPPPPDEPDDLSTSSSSSIPAIVPPPPDVQPIIDKMAKYVAKNGADFEATVRAKADSRFEFLLPWHSYHAYYEYKKKLFIGDTESEIQGQIDFENKTKKIPGPVSFCIKQKELKSVS